MHVSQNEGQDALDKCANGACSAEIDGGDNANKAPPAAPSATLYLAQMLLRRAPYLSGHSRSNVNGAAINIPPNLAGGSVRITANGSPLKHGR